jgi:hypothetical protein
VWEHVQVSLLDGADRSLARLLVGAGYVRGDSCLALPPFLAALIASTGPAFELPASELLSAGLAEVCLEKIRLEEIRLEKNPPRRNPPRAIRLKEVRLGQVRI